MTAVFLFASGMAAKAERAVADNPHCRRDVFSTSDGQANLPEASGGFVAIVVSF